MLLLLVPSLAWDCATTRPSGWKAPAGGRCPQWSWLRLRGAAGGGHGGPNSINGAFPAPTNKKMTPPLPRSAKKNVCELLQRRILPPAAMRRHPHDGLVTLFPPAPSLLRLLLPTGERRHRDEDPDLLDGAIPTTVLLPGVRAPVPTRQYIVLPPLSDPASISVESFCHCLTHTVYSMMS